MDNINELLANELGITVKQVESTLKLIDEGNTIPFIARYRKEATGNLDDEILRKLYDRLMYLRNFSEKKSDVIRHITELEEMTDEIMESIKSASTLAQLEDIYRPFRPKKRTKGTIAKELGLEPLANDIIKQNIKTGKKEDILVKYINEDKNLTNLDDILSGAKDIICENISDVTEYRSKIRSISWKTGKIVTKASKKDEKSNYEMYYDFSEDVKKIAGHRVLAINRGEKEKFLKVSLRIDDDSALDYLKKNILKGDSIFKEDIIEVIENSYKNYIFPAIEREIRSDITQEASENAIKVFGTNVKNLLLAAPLKDVVVMGFDPAFRTGCKLAIIDETGKLLDTATIYPTEPQNDVIGAEKKMLELIKKYNVNIIAIGNGTASRESEKFVSNVIKKSDNDVQYTIVSEAGASVYSASKLATKEYPNINVSLRGAISIARRLEDPLAELVKIDPKSIGVGQYQHDVNEKRLDESLRGVVENAVNTVGVDLNTATPSLLLHVSGVNSSIAENIVKYREENGKFRKREELLKVPKLGKAAYKQCAGFLKVMDSDNLLDKTMVHPESYGIAKLVIEKVGAKNEKELEEKMRMVDAAKLSRQLNVGQYTLNDIVEELKKPGRDFRDSMPKAFLRNDILKITDLKENMILTGTIRNVTNFGAFVDIGIKGDGLVHISEMSDKFIKDPTKEFSANDIVKVRVISVDLEKNRVALSMKNVNKED